MIRGFLEAAKLQDNPVNQLCKHMDWSLVFTQEDLGNLNILLSLMGPSEFLFSKRIPVLMKSSISLPSQ